MINVINEVSRCLLCDDAPCTKACPKSLDPARGMRALLFEDDNAAPSFFNADDCSSCPAPSFFNADDCSSCPAPCEEACIHYDFPLRIRELAEKVGPRSYPGEADLSIDFCGVHCENPFFLASSVISSNYDMIAKAFDMGWGGAVFKTIAFLNAKDVSPRFDRVEKGVTPFIGFRNMEQTSANSPEEDFATIARLKKDYPGKVIIASIMGSDEQEWETLARMSEEAGADMVECNFSCPHMKASRTGSDVGQNPELVRIYTMAVKRGTRLPVIAKMTPNITHIEDPSFAAKLGGADAIAAINTIKSITLNHRSEVSGRNTVSGYSGKAVKPIAQRCVLDIAKAPETKGMPLSGIGGIETWKDAIEYIRIGCSNVQVCTAVMQYGYRIVDDLMTGVQDYMVRHGVKRLSDIVGEALPQFVSPDNLDSDTFVLPRFDKEKCIGCGRCYVSCCDGGHQAIKFNPDTRRPSVLGRRCVGCHLCMLICPVGAISSGVRIPKP